MHIEGFNFSSGFLAYLERRWRDLRVHSFELNDVVISKELLNSMRANYILTNVATLDHNNGEAMMDYYCHLNKGGRQLLLKDSASIPPSLWPLVLERANHAEYKEDCFPADVNKSNLV